MLSGSTIIIIIDLPIVADLLQRPDDQVPPASGREDSVSAIQRGLARPLQQSRSAVKTQLAYSCHPLCGRCRNFQARGGLYGAAVQLISGPRRPRLSSCRPTEGDSGQRSGRGRPADRPSRAPDGPEERSVRPCQGFSAAQRCRDPAEPSRESSPVVGRNYHPGNPL